MGMEERDLARDLVELMDMANDIQDEGLLAQFQELESDLDRALALMEEPLESVIEEWAPATALPGLCPRQSLPVRRRQNRPAMG